MAVNTYTVLSSTSAGTREFGRYHAETPSEALAEANKDLVNIRAHSHLLDAVFVATVTPSEIGHLWIDGFDDESFEDPRDFECKECGNDIRDADSLKCLACCGKEFGVGEIDIVRGIEL